MSPMEIWETIGLPRTTPDWLALECYTEDEVLAGMLRWPIGLRLLDLLNSLYATSHDSGGDFLDFVDISREDEPVSTFISKAAIGMVTVSDANAARGAGGEPDRRYPYVHKSEIEVSIKLKTHNIHGTMHLAENEGIQDLLNRDALFLPVTNATIATADNRFYGSRPFIAVNKRHIISVQVEKGPRNTGHETPGY